MVSVKDVARAGMVGAVVVAVAANVSWATTPTFQGLGDLAGGVFRSEAVGVCADGNVAAGFSVSAQGTQAITWTAAGGLVNLGLTPSGCQTAAFGISPDGTAVVGYTLPEAVEQAFLWRQSQGYFMLGYLAEGHAYSRAHAVTNKGAVVVGESGPSKSPSGLQAFRWTQATGMVLLGSLGDKEKFGTAYDVSGDGSVIVGQGLSSNGYEAIRWTEATGMVGLGDLAGGGFYSKAYGVSDDGQVVVGQSESGFGQEAFRWTEAERMVGLGDLDGGTFKSRAMATSADGSVVVGYGTSALGLEASIWDAAHGMRSVRTILVSEYGLDLTGWKLTEAWGVSADGKTIAGYGTNPAGNTEGWVATLPEPATLTLLALGGLLALLRRRV